MGVLLVLVLWVREVEVEVYRRVEETFSKTLQMQRMKVRLMKR